MDRCGKGATSQEPKGVEGTSHLPSLVPNGDFSRGTAGWIFWTHPGAKGGFTVHDGTADIRIDDSGPDPWSVGLLQANLNIENGRTYEASFEAKADQSFTLTTQLQLGKEPWTSYSGLRKYPLSIKAETFTYTFTMRFPTAPRSMFQFIFPARGRVTISNVTLRDITQKPLESAPTTFEDRRLDTDIDRLTVFVFGQQQLTENNPQILTVKADINDRSVLKWGTHGNRSDDYNFDAVRTGHHAGALFMGGMTTVIQRQEFKDEGQFLDMATRDAKGELVPWADAALGIGRDMYRGSLANPKYRKYVTDGAQVLQSGSQLRNYLETRISRHIVPYRALCEQVRAIKAEFWRPCIASHHPHRQAS